MFIVVAASLHWRQVKHAPLGVVWQGNGRSAGLVPLRIRPVYWRRSRLRCRPQPADGTLALALLARAPRAPTRPRGRAAEPPSRRAAEPPSRRAAEPPSRRAAEKRDELAPPAWQEIIWRAAQRSLAVMCPAFVIDTIKAGTTVASAMLTRDRLQAALPRLQQQHKEVQEKEYVERWRKDFKRVEAKRDALATEYAETYPQVVEWLVDLLHRAEACDREASQVNCTSPSGARAHLCKVELKARGNEQLLQPDIESPRS